MWVALLAMASCSPCHEEIVRAFSLTGMARSLTAPVPEKRAEQTGRHRAQPWAVAWKRDGLTHRVDDEMRRMEWAVGSGHEGKSYLWRAGDAFFQSPLAWYTKRGNWDLSPGYAASATVDFLRPVTADCLFCHAGASRPVAGTLNRYAATDPIPQPGIHCERCHGDGELHAKDARRGNIVNPVRLSPLARDSVCEQCHLSGAARIPIPGKSFGDFRPGMVLEEVFSVYLPVAAKAFKVVSHAEQLVESACAKASGPKLWCGSCHDAHREPVDAGTWYRERCQTCHANTRPHGDGCANCHMPSTQASDGGHTAFTDHRIRKPGTAVEQPAVTALRAWREPAPQWRARGLGLAYAGAGELQRAYPLLRNAPADGEVQAALGLLYLRAGRTAEAVTVLEQAARAEPRHSTRRLNLAAALLAAGRRDQAKAEAEHAVALEPLLRDAYVLLAEIEPRRAAYWRDRFEKQLRK
jgi:hypothetical protein